MVTPREPSASIFRPGSLSEHEIQIVENGDRMTEPFPASRARFGSIEASPQKAIANTISVSFKVQHEADIPTSSSSGVRNLSDLSESDGQ